MAHPPSLLLALAQAAHAAGVAPHATVMLKAAALVEMDIGLHATMEGLLTAYTSITTTLAANGAMQIDDAIADMTDKLEHLRMVRDALANGRPLPNTKTIETRIGPETHAAWGGKPGGRA